MWEKIKQLLSSKPCIQKDKNNILAMPVRRVTRMSSLLAMY